MAYTTPIDWTTLTGQTITATHLNQQIRDNISALWVGTTAGDIDYYNTATTKARIPIGTANQVLMSIGSVPTWGNNIGTSFTPLSNTSYDGDVTNIGSYVMTPHAFNATIPSGVRGIFVSISVKWGTSSDANFLGIHATNSNGNGVQVRSQVANLFQDASGFVPVNVDGNITIAVGGANTSSTIIEVWGWVL